MLGRIDTLEEQLADERRRAQQQARDASSGAADELVAGADDVDGLRLVFARVEVESVEGLRRVGDRLRDRLGSARPAMTMVQVARLMLPGNLIEVEVEAVVGSAD